MHSKKKEENNSKKKEVQIKKFFQNIKCIIEDWLEHFFEHKLATFCVANL